MTSNWASISGTPPALRSWRPARPADGPEAETGQFELSGAVTTHPEEEVVTPSGRYKAVRVEFEGKRGRGLARETYWLAAGVGIVRETHARGQKEPMATYVYALQSFKPGKPAP